MNPYVIFLLVLLVGAVAGLVSVARWHWQEERRANQLQLDLAVKVTEMTAVTNHCARLEASLEDLRISHLEEVSRMREEHFRRTERMSSEHQHALEALGNLATYGTSRPGAAVVDRPEDPEGRVMRQVTEASIDRGAAALKERYREAGIPLTDEEARRQAESMLQLRPPIALGAGT